MAFMQLCGRLLLGTVIALLIQSGIAASLEQYAPALGAENIALLARDNPPAGFHKPASAFGRLLADALTSAGVYFEATRSN